MKKLPSLKAKDVVRILKKLGFEEDRQKGSHLILINNFSHKRTVVPMHSGKDIRKSLLKKIIVEDAGITIDEFLKILWFYFSQIMNNKQKISFDEFIRGLYVGRIGRKNWIFGVLVYVVAVGFLIPPQFNNQLQHLY